jgi:hypothetical protein
MSAALGSFSIRPTRKATKAVANKGAGPKSRALNMWTIDRQAGAATIARRSLRIKSTNIEGNHASETASKRDVSKLKPIGSAYCHQYQSDAEFYVDEAHTSGLRCLVVVYEKGGYKGDPEFLAGIPDDWSDQAVQDLILRSKKDGQYPAWEVPARAFGSDMLYKWWKGEPSA